MAKNRKIREARLGSMWNPPTIVAE